jgi:hypothetical protein
VAVAVVQAAAVPVVTVAIQNSSAGGRIIPSRLRQRNSNDTPGLHLRDFKWDRYEGMDTGDTTWCPRDLALPYDLSNSPASINAARTAKYAGLLMSRTWIVVRPMAVRPTSFGPYQRK